MTAVSPDSRTYLDPFCGSGTVLYEAVTRNCNATGMEVNPAAWHLAALSSVTALSGSAQRELTRRVRDITAVSSFNPGELYTSGRSPDDIIDLIKADDTDSTLALTLAAVVLLGMGNAPRLTAEMVSRGAFQVLALLRELSEVHPSVKAECDLGDARYTAIKNETIDSVITSPPYINVFNYHQNYRPAAELLGWNVLEAARTEIGSNRKHRMNRFLTVTQYCLDMALLVDEMARVLCCDGFFTIVLGRTSNVLGCSFQNATLVRGIIQMNGSFGPITTAERVFTNRFGERIFEDIIIARRNKANCTDLRDVRKLAASALEKASAVVPEANRSALFQAIEQVGNVKPSPRLNLSIPTWFQ